MGPPPPRPGTRDAERGAVVEAAGVRIHLADGNVSIDRVDLVLDTRLGPLELGAVYNSATKTWLWRHEMAIRGPVFVDESGAELDLAGTADGRAIAGTRWVRLDAHRVRTKGGLVHVFDPVDGRLVEVHWADGAYPALHYVAAPRAGAQRIVRVEQCLDASTCSDQLVFEHDASGCLAAAVDRAGRRAEYLHDPACRTLEARDGFDVAQGLPGRRYAYGGAGRLRAITSSEGERTELDYVADRVGGVRRVGEGDPAWTLSYTALVGIEGWATFLRVPTGGTYRYAFDGNARLVGRLSPEQVSTRWTWDGARPATRTNTHGRVWRFTFEDDEPVRIEAPSGATQYFEWARDAVNRSRPDSTPRALARDAIGVRESRAYDALGRLVTIVNGAGEATHFEWGDLGELVRRTGPDGQATQYTNVGEHGHAELIEHAGGVYEQRVFDAVGNLEAGDELGGELGVGRPGLARRVFDADRNVAEVWSVETVLDEDTIVTRKTTIAHRSDGRVARIETPYGGIEHFTYDALGRLVARSERVDGLDRYTTFEYDDAGRLLGAVRPNGMRSELDWDRDGHLVATRHLRAGSQTESVRFGWSGDRVVYVDDDVHGAREWIRYDPDGRIERRVHGSGGRTEIETDVRGREVRRRVFGPVYGSALYEITRSWDGADRPLSTSLDGEVLVERSWTSGQIDHVRFANGLVRSFERDPELGFLVGTRMVRPDGTVIEDLRVDWVPCWIEKLCVEVTGSVELAGPEGGAPVQSFDEEHYWVDWPPGVRGEHPLPGPWLRSWKEGPHGDVPYGHRVQYDALGNITAFRSRSGHDVSFELNPEHNRLRSGGLGEVHEYESDAAGFVTARDGVALEWTPSGRLSRVGADVELEWDGLGRIVRRTAGGTTKRFGYGGSVEVDQAGWPIATEIDGVHVSFGTTLRRFAHRDFRGNVQLVTDEQGRILRRHVYDGFGERHVVERDGTHRPPRDGERGFAGALHVAGLQLMGVRPYDPAVGRFLAPDPIDSVLNDFTYTRGNPIRLWDPDGLHATPVESPPAQGPLSQTLITTGESTIITGGAVATAGVAAGSGPAVVVGGLVYVLGIVMVYGGYKLAEPSPDSASPTTPADGLGESAGELSSAPAPLTCAPSTFRPRRPSRLRWLVLGLAVGLGLMVRRRAAAD